jgi:DNA-binding phage protein
MRSRQPPSPPGESRHTPTDNSLSVYDSADSLVSEESIAAFLAGAHATRDTRFIEHAQGVAERARAKLKG